MAHTTKDLRKHAAAASDETHDRAIRRERQTTDTYGLETELLGVKRAALNDLRDQGRIDDIVLRRMQRHLDTEEQRLGMRMSLPRLSPVESASRLEHTKAVRPPLESACGCAHPVWGLTKSPRLLPEIRLP
ncbi:hypothetical protein ABZS95_38850 [Streptomyces sp. NPDC005479]|uniref:hypothetical protein n=1 Tax=unclassified Streptomyces TaxID=2593676 RepID=UPI0033A8C71D